MLFIVIVISFYFIGETCYPLFKIGGEDDAGECVEDCPFNTEKKDKNDNNNNGEEDFMCIPKPCEV
jgi:hypothetical protein